MPLLGAKADVEVCRRKKFAWRFSFKGLKQSDASSTEGDASLQKPTTLRHPPPVNVEHGAPNSTWPLPLQVEGVKLVFNLLSPGDLRSVRLVCKTWAKLAAQNIRALSPTANARPSTITVERFPMLDSLDLTMVRGWGKPGSERWVTCLQKVCQGLHGLCGDAT